MPGKDDPVLQIGCGNSRLPFEMLQDGYSRLSNIDISSVVIEQMRRAYIGENPAAWCSAASRGSFSVHWVANPTPHTRASDPDRLTPSDLFPRLQYEAMDCRALAYPDGHFAAVIDKGTIGAPRKPPVFHDPVQELNPRPCCCRCHPLR